MRPVFIVCWSDADTCAPGTLSLVPEQQQQLACHSLSTYMLLLGREVEELDLQLLECLHASWGLLPSLHTPTSELLLPPESCKRYLSPADPGSGSCC